MDSAPNGNSPILTNTVRTLAFPNAPMAGGASLESLVLQSVAWIVGPIVVFGYLSVRQYKNVGAWA